MKIYLLNILFVIVFSYSSIAQEVEKIGFEQNKNQSLFDIPDDQMIKAYSDSLLRIYSDELLTAYVYSSLHEIVPNVQIEYSINNQEKDSLIADNRGRFFINSSNKINQIRISIDEEGYFLYDTVIYINTKSPHLVKIKLESKFKIMLRGRIFAGSMPIEGAHVIINHNSDRYNLYTKGCYTDEENYWNCLYLGMFKQTIAFENPADSISITIEKGGFITETVNMTMADYDGTVLPFKMKYAQELLKFPKNNLGIKFGVTFQNTWSVGINYIHQLQIGNFNRLGIGADGAMIISTVTTQYSTFNNLPDAEAETVYSTGMIGPLINFSITDPTNRLFNVYAGVVAPFLFPQGGITLHPYLGGKIYLDLNKAVFWEVKYIDYTINEANYQFNPYGNAYKIEDAEDQDYKKLLLNLGLLVSF